ncbi:MAG: hypothetical protein ABR549_05235 [Mycobacteriales bacterium]
MLSSVARRLGCTEGQLYTVATGLAVAAWLGLAGRTAAPADALAQPPLSQVQPGPAATSPVVVVPTAPVPTLSTAPLPAVSPQPPAIAPPTFVMPEPTPEPTFAQRPVLARVARPGAPGGLAVTAAGQLYVGTDNGTARGVPGASKLFQYDGRTGALKAAMTITGQPRDHADGLGALAVGPSAVYAVDRDLFRVLSIDRVTHSQTVAATVPDVKPCLLPPGTTPCEPGALDHEPALTALALDDSGALFISDEGQATIWRLARGARAVSPWYQSMDFATGDGPAGLALDNTGSLLVTVGMSLDTNNANKGCLYSISRRPDGTPGDRVLLASFTSSDRPGPVVMDVSGVAYVILRGTGTIVTVSGRTATRMTTASSPIPLDDPAALAIAGNRLLVANRGTTHDATHWAVLSFPLPD